MVRILLVDDNPSVLRYLRAILEQQSSWRVCGEARSGAEALKKVTEAPPDLILLDTRCLI
jgi:YesN/AraC family two-component response regulator